MCGLAVHVWTSGAVVMELFLLCSGLQSYLLDKAQTGVSGNGGPLLPHSMYSIYNVSEAGLTMYILYTCF